ncbi:unnamed protein product [Linum tenue]|uniref:Uncharacterized protein n=1 Tax=Linum tenue TaxID=586396 RepID=A0AAV0S3I7_9ROSI|nr:unnamed protein product [Linum tenue]
MYGSICREPRSLHDYSSRDHGGHPGCAGGVGERLQESSPPIGLHYCYQCPYLHRTDGTQVP